VGRLVKFDLAQLDAWILKNTVMPVTRMSAARRSVMHNVLAQVSVNGPTRTDVSTDGLLQKIEGQDA
jgi:hypothetical protein